MLTDTKIDRLRKPDKYPKLHADRDGLYLKHSPSGRKTWVHRTRKGGNWTVTKIGNYPTLKTATARGKLAQLLEQTHAAPLTREVVNEYWEQRIERKFKNQKNVSVYASRLRDAFGHKPIDQLTTRELADDLKNYAKDAPVAANRCLAFWKLIFKFAVGSGYLKTPPLPDTTATDIGGPESKREVTLTDDEIAALWQSEHPHAPLLRGLLLTGCRISELQAAKRTDIDGDTLHIPITKTKRPHWVHITPELRAQFGDFNGRLFDAVSPTAVQARLRRQKSLWTPHDLRRTFATITAKTQPPQIISKCLNHVLPGMLSVYNQHDYSEERRQASQDVAAYVKKVIHDQSE
jgi:integrase